MFSKNRLRLSLLALLILLNYLVWTAGSEANLPNLRVDVLDVGQGDAILIRTPSQQNILVDGGPDNSVSARLGEILPIWDRKLDLVVATHWDADHITGLVTVLDRYEVKEVLITHPNVSLTKIGNAWQQAVAQVPIVNYADATDDYEWGEVSWDTLLPLTEDAVATDSNNSSIVAKLTYKGESLLLTGDMEEPEEDLLMQIYPAISAEILKVAHHGSKYSSTAVFLDRLYPQAALISVGAHNSYGHPSLEALARLQAEGADIYRTDEDGTIEVIFGDNGYSVKADGKEKFYQN
ncbi:MAG: ComEC/Rec2 family competence protein [Patescibacteria group bacterium]